MWTSWIKDIFIQKMNYIHYNPIEACLSAYTEHYKIPQQNFIKPVYMTSGLLQTGWTNAVVGEANSRTSGTNTNNGEKIIKFFTLV